MKHISLAILLLFFSLSIWTQEQDITDSATIAPALFARLLSQGGTLQSDNKKKIGTLAPQHPDIQARLEQLQKIRPRIITEMLTYISFPQPTSGLLKAYDLFIHPSRLAGIQYIKPYRNNEVATLFTESHTIDNLEDRNIIPESAQETINSQDLIIRQNIPPFGRVVSKVTITARPGHISYVVRNHDAMLYKNIRITRPGKMFTSIDVIEHENGIIVYAIGGVRTTGITIFAPNRLKNSFGSRTYGLFLWFNTYMRRENE